MVTSGFCEGDGRYPIGIIQVVIGELVRSLSAEPFGGWKRAGGGDWDRRCRREVFSGLGFGLRESF